MFCGYDLELEIQKYFLHLCIFYHGAPWRNPELKIEEYSVCRRRTVKFIRKIKNVKAIVFKTRLLFRI